MASPPNTTTTKTTTLPPFTLSSPPGTDIWRKPPSHDVFTAPTHPSPLHVHPLSTFHRARLTFALPPASTLRQYDQAGLLLHLTRLDSATKAPNSATEDPDSKSKWLKTGIEWYYEKPYISTVGCDAWADWSVVPIPPPPPPSVPSDGSRADDMRPEATIEVRREGDALGRSLWVYWILKKQDGGEERVPLREVNWFFAEEEGWGVGVGGYVARPTRDGGEEELEVEFGEGVEIEVLDC